MRTTLVTAALGLLILASLPAPANAGRALRFRAGGDLVSTRGAIASGRFDLLAAVGRDGGEGARLWITAQDLDVTRDAAHRLPRFDAFVTPVGGGAAVLLGRLRVNPNGRARLRVRRLGRVLTGLGIDLRAQVGATFEVRDAAGAVLTGTLPGFDIVRASLATSTEQVYGRFVALQAPRNSPGSYIFRTDEHASAGIRNRIVVRAPGVLTGRNPPAYRVYLVNAAFTRTVDLGPMTPEPQVGASLTLDSRNVSIPGGIVRWSEFNGGRIEVRIGSSVRLRGDISALAGVGEHLSPVGFARAAAGVALAPTAGFGVGLLETAVEVLPNRRRQRISARIAGFSATSGPYTLLCTAASGTRTTLGTFNTRGPARAGAFLLDTRRGDHIPGGSAVRLGGQQVEVVDARGTTVLTATFPVLARD